MATVFTTHATLLGRYLAGDNPYFYDHLPFVDADREAAKYQIYTRFAIERAAAHAATVFTTVSEVTDREAQQLLGRKADVILPNGLNIQRFAAPHEFQHLHAQYKERIHAFVTGHFFPSYTFDLDNTIYLFTSGRYEYRNKGMDLFIEALHRLNWRLKGMPGHADRGRLHHHQGRHAEHQCRRAAEPVDVRRPAQHVQRAGAADGPAAVQQRRRAAGCRALTELMNDDAQVRLKRALHAWRVQPPTADRHPRPAGRRQ